MIAVDNSLEFQLAGDFTLRELNWGLDQLKKQILEGGARPPGLQVPGMLRGDGKRVPS